MLKIKKTSRRLFRKLLQIHFVFSTTLLVCYIYYLGAYGYIRRQHFDHERSRDLNVQLNISIVKHTVYSNDAADDPVYGIDGASGDTGATEPHQDIYLGEYNASKEYSDMVGEYGSSDMEEDGEFERLDILEGLDSHGLDSAIGGNSVHELNGNETPKGDGLNDNHGHENKSWTVGLKETAMAQSRLYDHTVLGRVWNADVFYISAIANGGNITLNGWQSAHRRQSNFFCCFKGAGMDARRGLLAQLVHWQVPEIHVVTATRYVCDASHLLKRGSMPIQVGLNSNPACGEKTIYVPIEYPVRPPSSNSSFAVCAKIVYGDYDAEKVFEWFEINRAMGVDHVSLFTYNVSQKTKMVMDYYEKIGFLTVNDFDFPLKLRFPRYIGQKYIISYVDEQVAVFDCVDRLRNYAYVALIDVDEMIVPHLGATRPNYSEMMGELTSMFQNSAGFTLQTSLFILDWEPDYPQADFMVGQYIRRTRHMWDRKKSIFMPSRVHLETVWTHGFESKDGFVRRLLNSNQGTLFHYRRCRPQWIYNDNCQTRTRHRDVTMKHYIGTIRDRLLETRKLIFQATVKPRPPEGAVLGFYSTGIEKKNT